MVFFVVLEWGGAKGQAIPQCGCKLGKNMQVLSTRLMERGALGERRSRRGVPCEVVAAAKVADECEWDCNKANDPPVWTTRPWRDTLGNRVREIPGADKQPFVALPTNHPSSSSLPSLPPSPLHPPTRPSQNPTEASLFSPALKTVGCGQRPTANLWRMCRVCKCEAEAQKKEKKNRPHKLCWWEGGWGGGRCLGVEPLARCLQLTDTFLLLSPSLQLGGFQFKNSFPQKKQQF